MIGEIHLSNMRTGKKILHSQLPAYQTVKTGDLKSIFQYHLNGKFQTNKPKMKIMNKQRRSTHVFT